MQSSIMPNKSMSAHKPNPETVDTLTLAGELRVVLGKLNRRLRKEANFGELTESQKSVLLHLERDGPTTVTALAKLDGVRPQSMGATVAMLEAAGLIDRAADPSDGRQTVLSLNAACRDAIGAGRAARDDWLVRSLQTHLTGSEQQELSSAVELIKRLADIPST
jgi:DNA-binding MarR family transcriptional regulator